MITEDPLSYCEALSCLDSTHWKTAIDDEMHSLIHADTWTIAELPTNQKHISCKWVFKRKFDTNGNVKQYKAQLVVKGYLQL